MLLLQRFMNRMHWERLLLEFAWPHDTEVGVLSLDTLIIVNVQQCMDWERLVLERSTSGRTTLTSEVRIVNACRP